MADKGVNDKIQNFFEPFGKREYAKGQIIILNGDKAEYVFLLSEGRVKQYDISDQGDEITLNVFKPGAFFPMSLAISGQPSPHVFEAETPIACYRAPAEKVARFIQDNPDVMYDLLTRVYRGMDGVLERMTRLMKGTAQDRLAYEILLSVKRFGGDDEPQSGINISEQTLAARTGLTRETVSRELTKMAKDGHLTLKRGQIIINDLADFSQKFNG